LSIKNYLKIQFNKVFNYELTPQNFRQTGVMDLTGGRKDYTATLTNKDDASEWHS